MAGKTVLVLGATGRTGRCVVASALVKQWHVAAYVRNPARITQNKDKLAVFTGDMNDPESLKVAIKACKPHAIMDCTSALRIGQEKGTNPNNADRGQSTRAILDALKEENRLDDCFVIIQGGILIPEPGGEIVPLFPRLINRLLRIFAYKSWAEATNFMRWLFNETPNAFQFALLRMGYAKELPTKGVLKIEDMARNYQRGDIAYEDVARVFVDMAGDAALQKRYNRKAFVVNY